MLNQTTAVRKEDIDALTKMIGRPVRGVAGIATRCELGCPIVAITRPFLDDGTPFPTTFYLACPKLVKEVSRLEDEGLIGELERAMSSDAELRDRLAAAQERFRRVRKTLADKEHDSLDTGIGGVKNFEAVKCLHAHLAYRLAGYDSPVGQLVEQLIPAPKCSTRCRR